MGRLRQVGRSARPRRRGLAACLGGLAGAALALGACARPAPQPPARVTVEVLSGARAPVRWSPVDAARVEILLDRSPSMRTPTLAGPTRLQAASAAAARLVGRLPASARVAVRPFEGPAPESACAGEPEQAPTLAAGLAELHASLRESGGLAGARVVVFSDLGADCGGAVCTAGAALVRDGAELDWVLFGDDPAPECLLEVDPDYDAPGAWVAASRTQPARFRIEPHPAPADYDASGWHGVAGETVELGAREIVVVVDLEPPARIGPLTTEPGALTRVRVLDLPAASPPLRDWKVERAPGPAPAASEAP